jgi:hypothetical protein
MVSTADIVAARATQKVVMASLRPASAAATSSPTLLTTRGGLSMLHSQRHVGRAVVARGERHDQPGQGGDLIVERLRP